MMEEREDVIILVDEDGEEHHFAVLDVIPLNLNQYAILIPLKYPDAENGESMEEEAEEAYIFRINLTDGEQILEEVEEEEEWNLVAAEWENRMRELEEDEEMEGE